MKRKPLLAVLMVLCTLCCAIGLAACDLFGGVGTGRAKGVNGVTYELSEDGTYAIATGFDYSDYNADRTVITVEATYKKKPVTTIGEYAFGNSGGYATDLQEITLPAGITTFEKGAFRSSHLEKVTFDGKSELKYIGEEAFGWCSDLTSFEIPDGVETIGNSAFAGTGLTNVSLPESVTSIGDYVFAETSALKTVVIPDSVTSMGTNLFARTSSVESLTLPFIGTSVEDTDASFYSLFGTSAFYNTTFKSLTVRSGVIADSGFADAPLETVVLGEGVTSIGMAAFKACENLTSVTLPSSQTEIGEYAFAGTAIETITLPEDMTEIPAYLFANSALKSIEIPASVTKIDDYAFYLCLDLESVTYAEGCQLETIGKGAFAMYGSIFGLNGYEFPYDATSKLATITVPESVTKIEEGAFSGCSGLRYLNWNAIACEDFECTATYPRMSFKNAFTALTFGASTGCKDGVILSFGPNVKRVPAAAFYSSGIISVTFGGGIGTLNRACESIGDYAFYDCDIFEMDMPVNLKTIGQYAFYSCDGLVELYIPSGVTSIGNYAFTACGKLIEVCNDSSLDLNRYLPSTVRNVYSSTSGRSYLFSYGMDGNDVFTFYEDTSGSKTVYYLMGSKDRTAHGLTLPEFVFKGNQKVSNTYTIVGYAFAGRQDDYLIINKMDAIESLQGGVFDGSSFDKVLVNGTEEELDSHNSLRNTLQQSSNSFKVYYYSAVEPTTSGRFWRYYNGMVFIW